MTTRKCSVLAGLGVLLLAGGCVGPARRAEIPVGQWSGTGTFVVDKWPAATDDGGPTTETISNGTYPTTLKIERIPGAGPSDVQWRLEIVSLHGEVEDLEGDRTHLVFVLRLHSSVADGAIRLYRLTRIGLSMTDEAVELDDGPEGQTHASCMAVDGDMILCVHYMEGFVDTFRFRGSILHKDGVYAANDAQGFIHWSETLRRQP